MLKNVYEVDEDGYLLKLYVAHVVDGMIIDSDKQHCIIEDYPTGLIKQRWDGAKWVEGATDAELEEYQAQLTLDSMKPSQEEINDAELEIKMITLLMEMELI